MQVRGPTRIIVFPSPIRTRGCARIVASTQPGAIMVSIAPPSHYSLRRLARLFEHEVAHRKGYEHGGMDEQTLYSLGPLPTWAIGTRLRYRGRAPNRIRTH